MKEYFNDASRRILLVAGAGFDPRTDLVAKTLSSATNAEISALLVQENRFEPNDQLARLAAANLATLSALIPAHSILDVDIFDTGNSVSGGRRAARLLSEQKLDGYTDLVVDISALSVGTSFPVIRYLIELVQSGRTAPNLHVMVAHRPELDARIRAVPTDTPGPVHGFNGGSTLMANSQQAARLWLPQLASGRAETLRRLYEHINPDEVCAILPFPASHPRLGDELLEELLGSDGFPWVMDARSIVHADEDDPLDLYRTILRLHTLRAPVFREVGGSLLFLSPIGSKVMALGALLAALEKDLPVFYVEDFNYELVEELTVNGPPAELMHVWLEGDPYPEDRPLLERISYE